jgi:hypothetical protein
MTVRDFGLEKFEFLRRHSSNSSATVSQYHRHYVAVSTDWNIETTQTRHNCCNKFLVGGHFLRTFNIWSTLNYRACHLVPFYSKINESISQPNWRLSYFRMFH